MRNVRIDSFGHVYVNDELICRPTNRETAILSIILSSNYIVTREILLSTIYNGRDEPEIKIFDVFITKLRKKLGPHRDMIQTVWGRGWERNKAYTFNNQLAGYTLTPIPAWLIDDVCQLNPGLSLAEAMTKIIRAYVKRELSNG